MTYDGHHDGEAAGQGAGQVGRAGVQISTGRTNSQASHQPTRTSYNFQNSYMIRVGQVYPGFTLKQKTQTKLCLCFPRKET